MASPPWIRTVSAFLLVAVLVLNLSVAHQVKSGSCPFSSHESRDHDHEHDHDHHHGHNHHRNHMESQSRSKLPEELAEEEDLELYGFDSYHLHDHAHSFAGSQLPKLSLWVHAMGCSLLVSMASLICLIILPVIFLQGKPSKTVVDSLAAFGAGAMLGDAFLHQLPHAFGGGHSHSHDHHGDHAHDHDGHAQSHSHSLKDLSVGLSILSGIVLFLLVEKVVRYVEGLSGDKPHAWHHGHHHHRSSKKLKDDNADGDGDNVTPASMETENVKASEMLTERNMVDGASDGCSNDEKHTHQESLRKRNTWAGITDDNKHESGAVNTSVTNKIFLAEKTSDASPSSLVFGYLNLFSDGVHNFTDGMALGSAFLLYGSVGGWSRTLFLLAHELPQEVGDFGILVRSGFSVSKALFFNFLSALVALAGTALALLLGKDPGQSSLIEGFTAGGFIYISVAGVLPEMNSESTTFRSTLIQLISLILGMAIALCISLLE